MLVLTLLIAVTPPTEAPGIVVLDLQARRGISKALAEALGEGFLVALKSDPRVGNVVGGSDLRAMFDLDQQKAAVGCADEGCLAEIGGALGMPYMLVSSLAKVGDNLVLNAKLMDLEAAKVLSRAQRIVGDETKLVNAPPHLVRSVLAPLGAPPTTAIKDVAVKRWFERVPRKGVGWGSVGLGAGVIGIGMSVASDAQSDFGSRYATTTSADARALIDGVRLGNRVVGAGIGVAALGLAVALVAP